MKTHQVFSVQDVHEPAVNDVLARLNIIGYSEVAVTKRLGLADICELQIRLIPVYRKECLTANSPLDIAIDLFLLQGTIKAAALYRLFSGEEMESLVQSGILSIDDTGAARAIVSLYPVKYHLIFSDHAWPALFNPEILNNVPWDQVMYVGADSRWLARATMRRPVEAALDLCTGSGIHALLAAAHARRAVAVDINPRAVRCTQFNAKISGIRNVEVATGDLYAPVMGEKFGLITANPPFVPSPVNSLGYRDGGRSGEDVQQRIVAGLAGHLAPGGTAHIVTELGERDAEPLVERVRQWLGGALMDIHLLRLRVHTAAGYSLGHAEGRDPPSLLESVDAWSSNLRTQGYVRIVSVLLTFQWSNPLYGPPWSRVDEALPPVGDAGAEIEAAFAAERMSRDPDLKERLERGRLRRTGPVILHEWRVTGPNQVKTCKATLAGQSLPVEHFLDPVELELLDGMDTPVDMQTLRGIAKESRVDAEVMFGAVRSLVRKRLVALAES